MKRQLSKTQLIERSITKKYRDEIYSQVTKSLKDYKLISQGDKIGALYDGTAPSAVMCLMIKLLETYGPVRFEAVFFAYGKSQNLDLLGLDANITKDFTASAEEFGCNKVTDSLCFDDVCETTLSGLLFGGKLGGILPKEKLSHIEVIHPLYRVERKSISAFARYNNLNFSQVENCNEDIKKARKIIEKLEPVNPKLRTNIFNSIHSVSADTIINTHK